MRNSGFSALKQTLVVQDDGCGLLDNARYYGKFTGLEGLLPNSSLDYLPYSLNSPLSASGNYLSQCLHTFTSRTLQ